MEKKTTSRYTMTGSSHVSEKGRRDFIYNEDKEYNPYYKEKIGDVSEEVRNKYEYGRRKGETDKQYQKRIKQLNKNKKLAEKEKKHSARTNKLGLTVGKVFSMLVMGALGCCSLSLVTYKIYMSEIKYPSEMVVDWNLTGMRCLTDWMEVIDDIEEEGISGYTGEESYLEKEVSYANSKEVRVQFFEKMLGTVEYIPDTVEAQNKYGNTLVNTSDEIVYRDSYVELGEEVTLKYVDYSSIIIDTAKVKKLMSDVNLKLGDAGYSNKLTDIFCQYMLNLDDIPTKEEKYVPNMYVNTDGTYSMYAEEDIMLDRLLFSSDDFFDLLERFSEAAGSNSVNPEWNVWYAYPEKTKSSTVEPIRVLETLPVTAEWSEWNAKENKEGIVEPNKYSEEYVISNTWCGAYYLQNEYVEYDENGNAVKREVLASLGDGSLENPASLGTEVVTVVKDTSSGTDYPISVRMIEYGVSEDALAWFESKDERNRGHEIKSEIQYVYYIFEIKNLSNYTLRVKDNSSLCDSGANLSERTGVIYGLNDTVVLKPNEVGYIESWSCSVNLNKKYIIWGANFARENEVVWFRKLAGDLEDTTVSKGVTLNTTRDGETELEEYVEEYMEE